LGFHGLTEFTYSPDFPGSQNFQMVFSSNFTEPPNSSGFPSEFTEYFVFSKTADYSNYSTVTLDSLES
jgi:hypothetical protein